MPPAADGTVDQYDYIEITASNGSAATVGLDITLNDGITRTLCVSVETKTHNPLPAGFAGGPNRAIYNNGVTETVQKPGGGPGTVEMLPRPAPGHTWLQWAGASKNWASKKSRW
jgi:hypothetical protein